MSLSSGKQLLNQRFCVRQRESESAVAVTRRADSVDSLDEMGRVMVVQEMF